MYPRSIINLFLLSLFCLLHGRVVRAAGPRGHILNLGHGVLVGTPEEAVAHFFDVTRTLRYESLFEGFTLKPELEPVS
jgi:uroporphyrinogen decarboxylase